MLLFEWNKFGPCLHDKEKNVAPESPPVENDYSGPLFLPKPRRVLTAWRTRGGLA